MTIQDLLRGGTYYYKGQRLYKIKVLKHDFNFLDIQAHYKKNGVETWGKFYLKDLDYIPHPTETRGE